MSLSIPLLSDLHVHLRQGDMMRLVVPHVRLGGVGRVLVMPNTVPPIATIKAALEYHDQLVKLEPNTQYLMTLYLTKEMSKEEIKKAAQTKGIVTGVKFYPKGVTTHSDHGVEDLLSDIDPGVFAAMEEHNMILHIHGEVGAGCCGHENEPLGSHMLEAEEAFLPTLERLTKAYPRLKVVLEHVTTKSAVDFVLGGHAGSSVACTVTPHHLCLTVDDVLGNPLHYCKPVAKYLEDKKALWRAIKSGDPRFFLGSDSAPHPMEKKLGQVPAAAGIYTLRYLAPLLAHLFEENGCLDLLENFACRFGPAFILGSNASSEERITLKRGETIIPDTLHGPNDLKLIPFWAGRKLGWTL